MAKGLDAQQQIFASNPDDRRAFEALEEHFFLEGDWAALARIYRDRIAAPSISGDAAKKGALLLRLGQILEERLVDLDAASEVYWTLARLDPTNRPALRQLRGIHERRARWDMVLQLAELEGATAMPPDERARFESDLARIWARQLGDLGEAERAYQRALAAEADFPPALEGLSELCLESGRIDEAADLLGRLTVRLRGPERAPFWLALGRLQALVQADREGARRSFAAALEDDPLLTAAVEWSLLLATEDEDWEAVAGLLEHRFDLAAGARHRASIAVEASQIHLHQRHARPSARAWVERARELAEDDGSVLRARADLERAEGNDDALAGVIERLVATAGPRFSRPYTIELAEIHARRGRPAEALVALQRAPAPREGEDQRVLALRADCLRATGAKRELAEVLETLVTLEAGQSPQQQASHLRELATLCEEELSDPSSAELHWSAAFAIDPADGEAHAALVRLQEKREDWTALRATHEAALRAAGASASPSLCSALGGLLLTRFEAPDAARALFERALSLAPRDRTALAGLRRVGEQSGDEALLLEVCEREADICEEPGELAEIARSAIALLSRRGDLPGAHAWAVRASESEPESLALLETRADLESQLGLAAEEIETLRRLAERLAGPERSRRLQRRAELLLELGDPDAAASSLEAALASEPDRVETLEALVDAYHRLGRSIDQARCLRLLCDRLPPEHRAEPMTRLASLLEDPIGDLDAAIAVRSRLLELEPSPAGAAEALEGLLALAGRHRELAALLERERQRLGDETPEARALDLRRGRLLLDALGDCEGAAAIFGALHEREPGDEEILTLLERALRAGHDANGLCELLARRAAWEPRPVARAPFELERAQLLEEVLGRPHDACDVYEDLLRSVPDSAAAVLARARLEALCEATGQWPRLQRLLLARLAQTPEPERIPLRERIAEICRDQLQDPAGCAAQLEAIAAAHPDRVAVWQQLQDLYMRVLGRPADWLRVAGAELSSVPAPRRELALRVAIGRVLLDDSQRPHECEAREAIGHYERVLELDPSHAEAVEILVRHYEREHRPEDVARVLESHLQRLDEARSADRDELRLRLARIHAQELGGDARARELLESVRTSKGAVPEVAEPLAEILERSGGPRSDAALAALCRDALACVHGERDRRPWRIRLGRSAARLGDLEEAARNYRAALSESPGDPDVEDALIEVYERLGEREPLIELLERRLAFVPAETELALRLRIARLYASEADEAELALPHLEQVLARIPHHHEALDLAVALATRIDEPLRARTLLDRALALPLPPDVRADCLERRAQLAGAEPAAQEAAVEDLRDALALEPSRTRARRALCDRLIELGRWPAALEGLSTLAESASGRERASLLEEGLALAGERLQPDAALPWLLRLRAERPNDPRLWARQAALHREAGRFEAALRALDEELLLHTEPGERLRVELERAALLEGPLSAPGRAVLAYQSALELASDREHILVRLDALLAALGRPLERAVFLEERVARMPGRPGISLRRELAEIYCVALAKPEQALVHLRANVEATSDSPDEELHHLGVLAAALRACGREEEWAAVATRELDRIGAHPALRDHTPIDYQRFLREEIARIFDRVLGDPEGALERVRELCDDPHLAEGGVPGRLRERLLDLLRRTGRKAELESRLAAHLASGAGTPREWLELAALRESDRLDWRGAALAYREAERDPALVLEAVRGRSRCADRLRDDTALAEALRDELALEDRIPRRARSALARRLGDLAWKRLHALDEARAAYRTALDLDPRDREAMASLIEIEELRGEPGEAISLYERELGLRDGDAAPDRDRRRTIQLRLAALHSTSEAGAERAIAAYREAEKLEPLAPADERALAQLYEGVGDVSQFRATFARWCDREDTTARVEDQLRLASQLAEAGETAAALARAERAVAIGPEHAGALALLGRLQHAQGRSESAIATLERAASHALPIEAARHCTLAAAIAAPLDAERARSLLLRAVEADPTSFPAHQALTRIESALDRPADAIRHAELALEIAEGRETEADERLDLALLGGRAARRLGQPSASLRLHGAAIRWAPDLPEALDGLAEAHFAAGDASAAKPFLERRLAAGASGGECVRPLWMLACALEAEGETERAAQPLREALSIDPGFDPAHESLVRLEERAARPHEALAALERWVAESRDAGLRARAGLRAAEHRLALGEIERARDHLDRATRDDPELAEAWVLACDLAAEHCDEEQVRTLCQSALEHVVPGAHSARIALRLARLAEVAGDRREAAARYAEAARWDPRCSEAALCASRLARLAGDWIEADGILARFVESHPDAESPSLAHVHLERGRLLSGPLESFEDAIGAYQRALTLLPGLAVARSALGGLLLHAPDRWREALALHREILATNPTSPASLQALATLAERRGQGEVATGARHVLASLGFAAADAPERSLPFGLALHAGPPLPSRDAERLRRLAHQVRDDLARLLELEEGESDAPPHADHLPTAEILAAFDELTAPHLARQPAALRRSLFLSLAGLFLDPGGNGGETRFRDPLDRMLGLWTRRKVRRIVEETSLPAIEAFDHEAWGDELRALAAAQILEREGMPLRPVLLALLALDERTRDAADPDRAEIAGLVSSCEAARLLMLRIAELLCEKLERSR
ncbi:MAG: tetratricopeptide repeat protein [Myxococcota bacterium]